MKEILNNIFHASNERVKNPFVGSMIISWILFNWRIWLTVLFSEKSIEQRINFVNKNYINEFDCLYFPLAFSIIYTMILPYLMWFIETLIQKAKDGSKDNFNKEKLKDIINKQKIAIEESKYENIKANYAEISELNRRIEELSSENAKTNDTLKSYQEYVKDLKVENEKMNQYMNLQDPDIDQVNNDEIEKYDKEFFDFVTTEAFTYFDEIGSEISQFKALPSNADKFVVEKLIYAGIIRRLEDFENKNVHYNFTTKGRYFWKKFILSKPLLTKQERDKRDELPF